MFRVPCSDAPSGGSDPCGVGDGGAFTRAVPSGGMSDKDLLGLVLGGIALLMFATGLVLVLQ
ncbi:hypothetical protein [Halobaculum lipolyticum]|uniref:PGF-CTERM sorting domain-containing protein n=1 Tax=Halobaculum lipolyticum TaxID=3032001 RepID=A0ABD5WHW1_9EURY|nr:hypothetical protein [Halobaculum sp. DT31]